MCEDDEHILAGFSASGWVNKRLLNIGVVHVQVSTQHAPEHAFERRKARAVDGASNEPGQANELQEGARRNPHALEVKLSSARKLGFTIIVLQERSSTVVE